MQPDLFDFTPDPPHQPHSDTSRAAAEAIAPRAATLRRLVLEWLQSQGEQGGTDEEGRLALGLTVSTCVPRRVELMKAGLVRDSGRTRPTRSGRQATVWIAA